MTSNDLQNLIASRLEDLATRVEYLVAQGRHGDAQVLRGEGLALAASFDHEDTFLVLNVTSV